ncbi:hypothetical protein HETIRDRAFT_453677 [Heterobasidion irregulare TC 32-1]|uniref:Uncharacterized protein n=1 Tax=Heterobasidion irregulare (strain TC 32-1) TaxID=747525 RepID=W4K088_HETIT|nr:uncharacterized protein HETIRDRAFT_453677 [Heterobasidion irregulare TC 32-1]ETW79207.1 hypothetical protein HETIRDRAFT_453677 [Heterobasidion irregulare TC 32-1]
MSASATSTDALVLMLSSESARRGAFAISLDVNLRLTLLTPYPLGFPRILPWLLSSPHFVMVIGPMKGNKSIFLKSLGESESSGESAQAIRSNGCTGGLLEGVREIYFPLK